MRARLRPVAGALTTLACAIALIGCGDDDPPPPIPDAGVEDSGAVDAGPPLTCATTTRVTPALGEAVSATFDTTMTEERPRDLGLGCGNDEAELRWAPQEVVELVVPGTGPVTVGFDTALDGTHEDFNTVVQVRRACDEVPAGIFPPACFDDAGRNRYRARGAVQAMGGETLYFLVTGFSEPPATQGTIDRGPVQIEFTARANTAPTLTSGFVRLANDDVMIGAVGMDADADAVGVGLSFRRGSQLLDIYGDGEATLDGDAFTVPFSEAQRATSFDGRALVLASEVNLGGYLRAVGATHVVMRAYDSGWAVSNTIELPITEATMVGLGDTCDDEHACRQPMSCSDEGLCEVTGAPRVVCQNGTVVRLESTDGQGMTTVVSGTTGAGYGSYAPSRECVPDPNGPLGAETVYIVSLDAGATEGTYDLVATTNVAGTGSTDTIIYLRSSCPDGGTELACNDDAAPGNVRSAISVNDLAPGVYYLFVESYGGLGSGTAPHQVQFTIRPVRAEGDSCDPSGSLNRCASGTACTGEAGAAVCAGA